MSSMEAISYTAARENLAHTMDKVCQDHAPVVITRKRDQAVVMLSLEDYEAMQETAYLFQSPKNAARLLKSMQALESGRGLKKKIKLDR
jgi:antitoxin YefM